MVDQRELLGVLLALEFVVAALVFLFVPLDAAVPLAPLTLVFLFALYRHRS